MGSTTIGQPCDGVWCHVTLVLCLYTVTGWGVLSCACVL